MKRERAVGLKEGLEPLNIQIDCRIMDLIRREKFETRTPHRRIIEERLRDSYARNPIGLQSTQNSDL